MDKTLEDVKDLLALPGVNDISELENFFISYSLAVLKRKSVNKSVYSRETLLYTRTKKSSSTKLVI